MKKIIVNTASFFDKRAIARAGGICYSVARAQPKGGDYPVLSIFAPPWKLIAAYRKGVVSEGDYKRLYASQVLARVTHGYIASLLKEAGVDSVTLLCWEGTDKFCHRHLVSEWLLKSKLFKEGELA